MSAREKRNLGATITPKGLVGPEGGQALTEAPKRASPPFGEAHTNKSAASHSEHMADNCERGSYQECSNWRRD